MSLPEARPISSFFLLPPQGFRKQVYGVPTIPRILDMLRTQSEIRQVGRARFTGSLAVRNGLYRDYRSFLRQATSNFQAASSVENRSASLLHYYAMLNFAKAELLSSAPAEVRGFIHHGLSFSPSRANTVMGDSVTVKDGAFRLLYNLRTGHSIPVGTRLPVSRLLSHIPELSDALAAVTNVRTDSHGLLHMISSDDECAWSLLCLSSGADMEARTATARLFRKHYMEVNMSDASWRDKFALSRRWGPPVRFYQSRDLYSHEPDDKYWAVNLALAHAQRLRDLVSPSALGMWDSWLTPSLYKSRMLPMPPALARYAVAYYASSLVRYRPSMFDEQLHPEQAYLFDAIARECALPMLVDTLNALAGPHEFLADDALRS